MNIIVLDFKAGISTQLSLPSDSCRCYSLNSLRNQINLTRMANSILLCPMQDSDKAAYSEIFPFYQRSLMNLVDNVPKIFTWDCSEFSPQSLQSELVFLSSQTRTGVIVLLYRFTHIFEVLSMVSVVPNMSKIVIFKKDDGSNSFDFGLVS